jgi:hypothetical protein
MIGWQKREKFEREMYFQRRHIQHKYLQFNSTYCFKQEKERDTKLLRLI